MSRHPQYPWLLATPTFGGYSVRCEACGVVGAVNRHQLDSFVAAHATHRSQAGVGAGDVVAAVAKPIAKAFGKAPCTPCERRRNALNSWMPIVPFTRRR